MNKKKTPIQEGMIKRHPDGFGFFIPDDPQAVDVYIPRHSMTGIMTNDRVAVEVFPERGTDRFRGEIVRILERGTRKVVGQFQPLPNGGGIIRDEGKGWGQDLKLRDGDTMNAEKDELVAAEIITYPDDKEFRGKVVQVIGSQQDPLNDIERVVQSLNIPSEFSKNAQVEASKLTPNVSEADIKGRKDLRKLKFITIDGATAKDFDDAIYIEQGPKGFRLFVAIADVSHYVRPGSAIDKDAYDRGTSVYFPNFVIPMLPEILSNELCSLNPHRPRLALVAEMMMDFNGTVMESSFYEAVIESHARVTYGEAQEIIEGTDIEKLAHVKEDILRASDLAKILMAKRFREGSLDLEIPETQLMIDGGGNPIDIIRSERLFAHRLIEEMMLAANVAVATFLSEKEIPAIYRIHEPPNQEAIMLLERYLRNFGGRIDLGAGKLQKRLTKALQEFEGRPEAQVLNILTLRSMSQAKYSSNNVGHFGLGFEFYTHFTSSIRRYPDLIVHRLIKSLVMPESSYKMQGEEELASAGVMLSACEQRSVKAERQIQGIKKARFMEKHVGEEFDGLISSVTKFGLFVLLRQFEVDGLIHIDNLGGPGAGGFEFDEDNLTLTAKRSGFQYSIGDAIKVRVVAADHVEGKIDFEPADRIAKQESRRALASLGRGQKKGKKHQQRRQEERPESRRPQQQAKKQNRPEPRRFEKPKERAREVDELDLDSVPVQDHSREMANQVRQAFDPGKKLEEALRRRGLKPSTNLGDGPPQKLGFRSKFQREERRAGGDRRKSESFEERTKREKDDEQQPRRFSSGGKKNKNSSQNERSGKPSKQGGRPGGDPKSRSGRNKRKSR